MKKACRIGFVSAICLFLLSGLVWADQAQLKIGAEAWEVVVYKLTADITADTEFTGIPIPKMEMQFKNVLIQVSGDVYWLIDEVTEEGEIYGKLAFKNLEFLMGDILPSSAIFGMMGMPGLDLPDMEFSITPQGKIGSIQMDMSKMMGGMGGMGMGGEGGAGMDINPSELMSMLLPMMIEMMPPILPEEPVEVGATWSEVLDMGGGQMPMLPKIKFDFTLNGVDDAGIATIGVDRVGNYDGAMLKGFLSMFPAFELNQIEYTLADIDIKSDWDDHGAFTMNTITNRPMTLNDDQNINIHFAAAIKPVELDPERDWNMKGDITIKSGIQITFVKVIPIDEYNEIFPAPVEEEETPPDEESVDL